MTVSISKWGNSAAVRIPKNLLEELSLHIGDDVNIHKRGNTLVIEPHQPKLEVLLNKVTPENRHSEVFTDSIGNEML